MRTRLLYVVAALLALGGCAHKPLSGAALDEVRAPAFISRIEEEAGPRSWVFREDSAYAPKLKRLEPKEADRRLANKLREAMGRFEMAERLRASTVALLPRERPWTNALDPVTVSSALQQFLVDEVPANAPDYNLVKERGADAVVEFVIEEYGLRSEGGKTQAYLLGYGRMFRIGGGELWRRNFKVDLLEEEAVAKLDPFRVAKDRQLWRDAVGLMLDTVARQMARDLTPERRGPAAQATPADTGSEELEGGEDARPPRQEQQQEGADELPPGELPDPDPL